MPSQHPGLLCATSKAQIQQFQGACPVFSEAGTSAGREGKRSTLEAWALCPPLEGGLQKLLTHPWLIRTSGCCSLPLLLLKTFAGDDPSQFPCLWVGCVSCWLLLKVTQQVWSGMLSSLPFVLFCFRCSFEFCGSFWLHTVQGTSRTSPCGSLLFLFAASVVFYPSLTGLSLTAFLLRRPS